MEKDIPKFPSKWGFHKPSEYEEWRAQIIAFLKERRKKGIKTRVGFYYQTDPYLEFLEALK